MYCSNLTTSRHFWVQKGGLRRGKRLEFKLSTEISIIISGDDFTWWRVKLKGIPF